jgi:cell pole-organizing protein PopZ
MRQSSEPSVEEILASIKKVIARDNRAESARRDWPQSATGSTSAAAARDRLNDVLDLGEVAAQVLGNERATPPQHSAGKGHTPHAAPGHADDDQDYDGRDEDGRDGEDSPLLNEVTASAMRDSLAALAALSQPGARPQIVRSGETSLEGLVRDLLRPMLAQWLDDHLPAMVERMVAAEIARILHKKG